MGRIEYTAGDFIGDNGLIFIEETEPRIFPSGKACRKAFFLCVCGKKFDTRISYVRCGDTQSCGCVKIEECKSRATGANNPQWRGGLKSHYLWDSWRGMMARCYSKKATGYHNYGGRGIEVFKPWHDSAVFLEFCDAVLGERPEGHTLDRIDNDGNYEPSNVRWADRKTQRLNQGSSK